MHALQVLDLESDAQLIRKVAEDISRPVSPSAGPVRACCVGYVTELAAASGHIDTESAMTNAAQKRS